VRVRHPQTGRSLDSAYPQPSERGHGSWYFDCAVATVRGRRDRDIHTRVEKLLSELPVTHA
jgi:hypothetical protein